MTETRISSELDYSLDNLDDRIHKVEEIIEHHDSELVAYFDDYYNPSLNQNSRLSEHDGMCRQLERMADYLLYAENKEKRKDSHGDELHIVSNNDNDKNKKKEYLTDDLTFLDKDDDKVNQHKLYKKVKVTKKDREEFPELAETGRAVDFLKNMIDTGIDSYGDPIDDDSMRKLRWFLIDIRKDEVAIKESLKGYIRFKRLSPESESKDFSQFDFMDIEHVRILFDCYSELKQNSYEDINGYMRTIIQVFEEVVDSTNFEDYMFDIFIMKIDGLSRSDIVSYIKEKHELDISERMISEITRNTIPQMIVKTFEENYEDWVYTFKIKGIYKTCSKCDTPKLTRHFGKDSRNKDGVKSICKDCDSRTSKK